MIFEEDARQPKTHVKILDNMSVDELNDYINDLKQEIIRVEEDIKRKHAQAQAAETFFGK